MPISLSIDWRRQLGRRIVLPGRVRDFRLATPHRMVWLLFVVSCAMLTTLNIVDFHDPSIARLAFVGLAWTTVLIAWCQQRCYFRNSIRHMAVFLFWITIVFTPIVWYSVTTPASETTRADRDDNTLRDAILHDDIPTVRGMLARGVDPNYDGGMPNYRDGQLYPENLLGTAVSHGRVEAARLLIRHGADMRDENRSYSLLATAASDPSPEETPEFMPTGRKGGNIPMMRLLIQSGLHVNDSDGTSSALWAAVNSDMVDSVQFLLQHGANPNTRGSASNYMATSDGKMSVVHLSRCRGCIPITKMLKHAGANE